MKDFVTLCILTICGITNLVAQDRIITKEGDVITAYRLDIGGEAIYYKLEDTDSSPLQSIGKNAVLMVKKKDGSKVNMYEKSNNQNTNPPVSDASQSNNAELIRRINSTNPTFIGEVGEKAKNVFCLLGCGAESQLENDDISITSEIGRYIFRSGKKASLSKTISKHADNERGDLVYQKINKENKYNFTNPALLVRVTNKTNRNIYVDLANTFIERKGEVSPYYVPSSSTTTITSGSGVGVNMGAVAGAVGIGGVVGTLANGVNVGGGSSLSTSNTVYAQRVIIIPPKMTVKLDPQLLFVKEGKYCDGFLIDNRSAIEEIPEFFFDKEDNGRRMSTGEVLNYDEKESPIKFKFMIGYSFNTDCTDLRSLPFSYYLRSAIGFPGISNDNMRQIYPSSNCNKLPEVIPNYSDYLGFVGYVADGDDIRYFKAGWFDKGVK